MPDARTAACWALLAGGACITLGSSIYAGQPQDLGWFARSAPYLVWAAAPYLVYALAAQRMAAAPAASRVLLASALLVGMTTGILVQTFVVAADAQGGLVFLFLPLWQLLGLLPFWLIVRRLRARARAAQ